jgi:hypothetical protein
LGSASDESDLYLTTDIFERDGRSGRLLFRTRENVLTNQRGELVAKARSGHVRSYDLTKLREGRK